MQLKRHPNLALTPVLIPPKFFAHDLQNPVIDLNLTRIGPIYR